MSVAAVPAILAETLPAQAQAASPATFEGLLGGGLNSVNRAMLRTESDAQRLAAGEIQNLHQVMINLEEAKMGFQLVMQVRNRMLEAYQEVMRMQI